MPHRSKCAQSKTLIKMGYDFKTVAGERPEVNPEVSRASVTRLSPIEDVGLRMDAIRNRRIIPNLASLSGDVEALMGFYQEGSISKREYQVLLDQLLSLSERE